MSNKMYNKSVVYLYIIIVLSFGVSHQNLPDAPPIVVACFQKMYPITMTCVTDAYRRWNMTYSWEAPVAYDPKGRQSCCSGWQAFDCYERQSYTKCNSSEQIAVKRFIAQTIDLQSKGDCVNYAYHSPQCSK